MAKEKDEEPIDLQSVIAQAYSAVAEPERFVSLMPIVVETADIHDYTARSADGHFENTLRILDKLYPLEQTNFGAIQTQADQTLEGDLALTPDLTVLSFKTKVFGEGVLSEGQALPEQLFNPITERADREKLRAMPHGNDPLFFNLYSEGESVQPRWFSARKVSSSKGDLIILSAVRLRWDDSNSELFGRAFALTPTEIALTQHLVTGGSVRDFAESRDRSLGTVRNQLKALQRKLEINSKEQLLLLYAGFIHSLTPTQPLDDDLRGLDTKVFNIAPDVQLACEQCGDPFGDPILYFHPLEGAMLPRQVHKAAADRGLRIIAPWRPGMGESTAAADGKAAPQSHAPRLVQLLDQLGIETVAGLATQAGMPFLVAAANHAPERFAFGVGAGAFLPFAEKADFAHLSSQVKVHIMTSRVAPSFAKTYIRAMLASFGNGQFFRFVEDFYKDCPNELATARDPEIVGMFRHAASYGLSNRATGMIDTMLNWSNDWSAELEKCPVPLHYLLGERDGTTPRDLVDAACERYGIAGPIIVPSASSFVLYEQPDAVMMHLRQLHG